ncbi:tetratricopeptide repeat protein [Microcoleus vaginatus GB1-A2]|uniref:tetratricopeptide repeat protein n=1 Tax=Microcoleus vaginatus TaxID=119532 RepID=UPI001689F4C7|nr:tetratricopeptide repeat protein [Microcoleus sp. FACHB-61]
MKLELALAQYTDALTNLKLAKSEPSEIEILHILVTRDAIEEALSEKTQLSVESLAKLLELDNFLKQQAHAIARGANLAEWRATFHPSTEAWWWFLEPTSDEEVSHSNRLDPLFNGLTIAGLTAVAAYMTTFVQLFATGGFGFLETLGLLGQGGLILTVIRTLQNTGQEKIKNLLKKLNISPQFHSQATLGITAMLLLASVGVNNSLPEIGKWNYREGKKLYKQGLLVKAKAQYEQAAKIAPQDSDILIALGEIYESLGDLDPAQKLYQRVVERGDARAFNNLGRVYISKKKLIDAESLLRIGLEEFTKGARKQDNQLNYELHLNLGWVLLEQGFYEEAEKELRKAVDIDEKILEKQLGGGMAYCLLPEAMKKVMEGRKDQTKEKQRADDQKEKLDWEKKCMSKARPETIDQYKWFIDKKKREMIEYIDTSGVVTPESQPSTEP